MKHLNAICFVRPTQVCMCVFACTGACVCAHVVHSCVYVGAHVILYVCMCTTTTAEVQESLICTVHNDMYVCLYICCGKK